MNNFTHGIYAYLNQEGEVVYIGKDKAIDQNTRHKEHHKPSKVNDQVINKVLSEEQLDYIVLCYCLNGDIMNIIEKQFIYEYKPKYNVRIGIGKEKERMAEHNDK